MNRFERRPLPAGEAQVEFLDGDLRVLRPGAVVRCAVTGEPTSRSNRAGESRVAPAPAGS